VDGVEQLPIGQRLERYYQTLRIYPRHLLRARAAAAVKRHTLQPLQAYLSLRPARRVSVRARPPILPGVDGLRGRADFGPRLDLAWERTRRMARGSFDLLNHEVSFKDRIDWACEDASVEWREVLQGGGYLLDAGLASLEEPEPDGLPYTVFRGIVRDWMRGNRPGRGEGWRPYALSRRVVNWIYAAQLCAPALTVDEPFAVRMRASLFRQVKFLERNIERYRADSHLIANSRALFIAGYYFEGEEGARWRLLGQDLLWAELRNQFGGDGGHCERSPMRHAAVLADYLEVLAILRTAGEEVPPWVAKKVRGMAGFLQRLLLPDGALPTMHDSVPEGVLPPSELLAMAAAEFREPGLRPRSEGFDVWPYVVLGDDGARIFITTKPAPPAPPAPGAPAPPAPVRVDLWSYKDAQIQPMQQARANQEYECGCNFHHHQGAAQPLSPAGSTPRLLQRLVDIDFACLNGRNQTKHNSG